MREELLAQWRRSLTEGGSDLLLHLQGLCCELFLEPLRGATQHPPDADPSSIIGSSGPKVKVQGSVHCSLSSPWSLSLLQTLLETGTIWVDRVTLWATWLEKHFQTWFVLPPQSKEIYKDCACFFVVISARAVTCLS